MPKQLFILEKTLSNTLNLGFVSNEIIAFSVQSIDKVAFYFHDSEKIFPNMFFELPKCPLS